MMTNAAHAHANAMSKMVQFSSTKRSHRISTAFIVEITNTCSINSIFLRLYNLTISENIKSYNAYIVILVEKQMKIL